MRKEHRAGHELPALTDNLSTPVVGEWAEDKYRLVHLYAKLFTTSMRGKWSRLIYLDLFAGAGRSTVRGSGRILPGSPTLALSLDPPFDRYVFCEAKTDLLEALDQRVVRDFPGYAVDLVAGDVNEQVPTVRRLLPAPSSGEGTLTFCFVDPFSLKNLRFETLEGLCDRPRRRIDFLVLIPTGYDATRNEWIYAEDDRSDVVERFLGNPDWREEWSAAKTRGVRFETFIVDAFGASMQRLDYIYNGIGETQLIRLPSNKAPLYRLALFSRHKLGAKFWREVRKYAPDQRSLF